MSAAPFMQGQPLVTVHLSEVPERIRVHVADRMIRVGALEGTEALDLKLAAIMPRQDPSIEVASDVAARILGGRMRSAR